MTHARHEKSHNCRKKLNNPLTQTLRAMHNGNERYRNLIFCRSSMLRLFLWQEEDWLFEDRNLQKRRRGKGFFANTPETKLNNNSWQIAVHLYALFYYPFSFSLVKQRCTETKQRSLKYARRLPVVKLDVTRGLLNVTFVVLGISVTKIQVMLEQHICSLLAQFHSVGLILIILVLVYS